MGMISSHVHTVNSYLLQVKFECVKTNTGACYKRLFWSISSKLCLSLDATSESLPAGFPGATVLDWVCIGSEPEFIPGLFWSRFLRNHFLYSGAGVFSTFTCLRICILNKGKEYLWPLTPFPLFLSPSKKTNPRSFMS